LFPSRVPLGFGIIEDIGSMILSIRPGFAIDSIREIVAGTSDGKIHDEVEFLIEGGGVVSAIPWVFVVGGELSKFPHGLLGEINF